MNCVILCGRLVREPQTSYTAEKMAIAKFTLAVDRRKKDEADFISCTAFGKSAEFTEKYLTKGTKIIVSGRWQTGSYKNKEGQTVYTNDCVIESIEFAESKRSDEPKPDDGGFVPIPDSAEELPFN